MNQSTNLYLWYLNSLETFGEIFSSVKSDLLELLSSGHEEELNFGQDATENGLFIVRLIAILIFTVHNVNRESEGQSYAEILKQTVLLQNAFTAAFEFAGHVIKRCIQLRDAASSFLLPAILVFIEWLACHPDIASGSDVEEKQAVARSFFWNQCVTFMNKLILSGLVAVDVDKDETCFFDMSRYDETETGNRLALWEDFELRGFLPLVQAQLILDFSRKHSYGSDGSEERQARVQRIIAAGKAIMNVVRVDQKTIYFDPRLKKFAIGIEPPAFDNYMCNGLSDAPKVNVTKQATTVQNTFNYGMTQPEAQLYANGEDEEEEEIVFKPIVGEKYPSASAASMSTAYEMVHLAQISTKGEWTATSMSTVHEAIQPAQISSKGEWESHGTQLSTPLSNFQMSTGLKTSLPLDATTVNLAQQPLPHMNLNTSKWLMAQAAILSNELKNFNINGNGLFPNHGNVNGLLPNHGSQEGLSSLQPAAFAFSPLISSSPLDPINRSTGQIKVAETFIPSTMDSLMPSGITCDGLAVKPSGALLNAPRKTPVSRPIRHLGPPPGFSSIPLKQLDDSSLGSAINGQNPQFDDYSWLDGYQSSSTKTVGMENSLNHAAHMYQHPTAATKMNGVMSFPFPGKEVTTVQTPVVNEKWQDFQLFDHLKPNSEQQLQQTSFQPSVMPEQYQAHSLWSGYFV